ncbi:MAG: hypothetical protein H9893_06355 [Candidatus Niameybacter stercoravium]|nr:hypothetical protein [Candidatus Niameybacter stercoravium]
MQLMPHPFKSHVQTQLDLYFKQIKNFISIELDTIELFTNSLLEELSNQNVIINMLDLKYNDSYTSSHCINVSIINCAITQKIGLNSNDIKIRG